LRPKFGRRVPDHLLTTTMSSSAYVKVVLLANVELTIFWQSLVVSRPANTGLGPVPDHFGYGTPFCLCDSSEGMLMVL
jgi:hypothetical protein